MKLYRGIRVYGMEEVSKLLVEWFNNLSLFFSYGVNYDKDIISLLDKIYYQKGSAEFLLEVAKEHSKNVNKYLDLVVSPSKVSTALGIYSLALSQVDEIDSYVKTFTLEISKLKDEVCKLKPTALANISLDRSIARMDKEKVNFLNEYGFDSGRIIFTDDKLLEADNNNDRLKLITYYTAFVCLFESQYSGIDSKNDLDPFTAEVYSDVTVDLYPEFVINMNEIESIDNEIIYQTPFKDYYLRVSGDTLYMYEGKVSVNHERYNSIMDNVCAQGIVAMSRPGTLWATKSDFIFSNFKKMFNLDISQVYFFKRLF